MKKITSIFLLAFMVFSLFPQAPARAVTDGDYDYEILDNGTVRINHYVASGAKTVVEIPSEIGGKPVTEIGDGAFYYRTNITSVTIPDGVVRINNNAFGYCKALTNVVLPDSLTDMGQNIFQNCSSLAKITLPDNITHIDSYIFYGTALYNDESNWDDGVLYLGDYLIEADKNISGEYDIKPGTKVIADRAFDSCENLTAVTIPDSVTHIGEYSFNGCTNLTSLAIPEGVTDLFSLENTFCNGCQNLKSLTLPRSTTATTISRTFYGCESLESIIIPDGIECIEDGTFENCKSLKSITLPASIKSISSNVFNGCDSLTDIYYAGSIDDWNKIAISIDAGDGFKNATIHFDSAEVYEGVTGVHGSSGGANIGSDTEPEIGNPDNVESGDPAGTENNASQDGNNENITSGSDFDSESRKAPGSYAGQWFSSALLTGLIVTIAVLIIGALTVLGIFILIKKRR